MNAANHLAYETAISQNRATISATAPKHYQNQRKTALPQSLPNKVYNLWHG